MLQQRHSVYLSVYIASSRRLNTTHSTRLYHATRTTSKWQHFLNQCRQVIRVQHTHLHELSLCTMLLLLCMKQLLTAMRYYCYTAGSDKLLTSTE
jgi:membrane protein required for beta-lactamase induction